MITYKNLNTARLKHALPTNHASSMTTNPRVQKKYVYKYYNYYIYMFKYSLIIFFYPVWIIP